MSHPRHHLATPQSHMRHHHRQTSHRHRRRRCRCTPCQRSLRMPSHLRRRRQMPRRCRPLPRCGHCPPWGWYSRSHALSQQRLGLSETRLWRQPFHFQALLSSPCRQVAQRCRPRRHRHRHRPRPPQAPIHWLGKWQPRHLQSRPWRRRHHFERRRQSRQEAMQKRRKTHRRHLQRSRPCQIQIRRRRQ